MPLIDLAVVEFVDASVAVAGEKVRSNPLIGEDASRER